MPPETFRIGKLDKFIQSRVNFMELQQKSIESLKQSKERPEQAIHILEISQTVTYNYTFDLCREFGIEMPIVLGVTP